MGQSFSSTSSLQKQSSIFAVISLLLTQASAESTISDLIRKMTKPEADEQVYMYAGIVVCLAVLYIIYSQLSAKKPEFSG
jgi:nucleoside permease NupC